TPAISMQTATLLYGTTFEEGPMNPRQMQELSDAGLENVPAQSYGFFIRRFREPVAADPAAYLSTLGTSLVAFFSFRDVVNPVAKIAVVTVLLAGVLIRWKSRRRLAWLAAFFVVAPAMLLALH